MKSINLKTWCYWAFTVIPAYGFIAFYLWKVAFPACVRSRVSVFYMIISTPNFYINHLAFNCDETDRMKKLELADFRLNLPCITHSESQIYLWVHIQYSLNIPSFLKLCQTISFFLLCSQCINQIILRCIFKIMTIRNVEVLLRCLFH